MPDASDAPTFVVCNARSGSTLLRWLLDTHPELACPAETDIALLLESFVTAGTAVAYPDMLTRARAIADDVMDVYVRRAGKSRWCDKSLSNVLHLDTLATVWPSGRFLVLHRHVMDFVRSALDAQPWGLKDYGFAPYAAITPTDTVTALLAYWIERTTKMLVFEEQHPERCLRVRYEDLVLDTEGTLGRIWPFLGIDALPDAAAAAFATSHDAYGSADYKVWYTAAVQSSSVGQGARIAPDRVAGLARRTVNELLGRLGYDLVGDDWGSGGRVELARPDAERSGAAPDAAVVELRVVDGMGTVASRLLDLAAGTVLAAAGGAVLAAAGGATPAPSSVVAVERGALAGLCSGQENVGAALRARTVRYYGHQLQSFAEERVIFDRLAAYLVEHRADIAGVLDGRP